MHLYLMESATHRLDQALKNILATRNLPLSELDLAEDTHEAVRSLLIEREPGLVFMPAIWQDLFGVKTIQEIRMLPVLFETIMCGPAPEPSHLVVAFNEGVGAYLQTPATESAIDTTIRRLQKKLADRIAQAARLTEMEKYASGSGLATALRDQMIARALLDLRGGRGPLLDGNAHVLMALASKAQAGHLDAFLKQAGFGVDHAPSIADALKLTQTKAYVALIADGVLPDGSAVDLAIKMRKSLKLQIPRVIVWTSSPERHKDFLKPGNYIDEVVLKPSPDAGMESILISIIMGLYQNAMDS